MWNDDWEKYGNAVLIQEGKTNAHKDRIHALFPSAGDTPPGKWCREHILIQCADTKLEISAYRESEDNDEYAGTLTLQIFAGDDVIFCEKIDEPKSDT